MARRVIVLSALTLLGACVTDLPAERSQGRRPQPTWGAPTRYMYDLESSCGEQDLIGEFRIRVKDGEVVHVDPLDDSAQALLRAGRSDAVLPLEGLVDQAIEAVNADADVVNVEHEGPSGSPSFIEIDYRLDATDDESCYEITHFRKEPPPLAACEATTEERDAAVQARISPCLVFPDDEPQLSLKNVGDVRVAYGTPFKLERRVNGSWNWANKHQGWDLPLFHLPVGKRASEPIYHWIKDTEKRFRPGLYRVTKEVNLGNVHGPVMKVRVHFRVLDERHPNG